VNRAVNRVLADTSVWIAHFRRANPRLQALIAADRIACRPLVIIELACGTPPAPRKRTLGNLAQLHQVVIATTDEVLALIEKERLHDAGCGAIDMALLASARLTPSTALWTLDKKLAALARRLRVEYSESDR